MSIRGPPMQAAAAMAGIPPLATARLAKRSLKEVRRSSKRRRRRTTKSRRRGGGGGGSGGGGGGGGGGGEGGGGRRGGGGGGYVGHLMELAPPKTVNPM
eukprot:208341-Hanusia_phi.AAC.1